MRLYAYARQWPPPAQSLGVEESYAFSTCVNNLALSWEGLAQHVSHTDLSGRALRSALDACGLRLACVELSPLTCTDTASFEKQTDDAYMQMQLAERLGATMVVIASGHAGSDGVEHALDAVTRLASLAERMELTLGVRNVCDSAFERFDTLRELFARVGSRAVGLCLDNREFQRAVMNPADAVLSFAGGIAAVRLRDEAGRRPCTLGDGQCHVDGTMEALVAEGFSGPLLVDVDQLAVAAERFVGHFT